MCVCMCNSVSITQIILKLSTYIMTHGVQYLFATKRKMHYHVSCRKKKLWGEGRKIFDEKSYFVSVCVCLILAKMHKYVLHRVMKTDSTVHIE